MGNGMGRQDADKRFHGWYIVAALFVMLAFSSGLGFYLQSVLLAAFTEERGLPVAVASVAPTLFFAVSGLTGLGVAVLLERRDVRVSVTAGTLLAATALALLGQVQAVWQAYVLFALFGCGFAGANMLAGTTLVTRWFSRHRSLAMAISATGLSVGGMVITPLAARLVEARGLAQATPVLAVGWLVGILPVTLLVLRDRPENLGQRPDGEREQLGAPDTGPSLGNALEGGGLSTTAQQRGSSDPQNRSKPDPREVPFSIAIRSRFFVAITVTFFLGLGAQVAAIAHQYKWIADQADTATAALGVAVMTAASATGRLIVGWLLRYVPLRLCACALAVAQALGLAMLGQAAKPSTLLLTSGLFGLCVGSFLLMRPLLIAEAFGVRYFPRLYSIHNVITSLGVALGPAAVGIMHDQLGGYPNAFLATSAASLLAATALTLAGSTSALHRAPAAEGVASAGS